MINGFKAKNFAQTFIYSVKSEGYSTEQQLLAFLTNNQIRINKNHDSMNAIKNMVRERQSTAVLYRMFMDPDVVFVMDQKELPASFKVFAAKDPIRSDKKVRIFIDATGLFKFENGYYSCKEIDKLCTYLTAAAVIGTFYSDPYKLTNNSSVVRTSATCFTKLFTATLDNLRPINYQENKTKIGYIATVYYLFTMVQKDMKSAETIAASIMGLNPKEAAAYRLYYQEEDFANIDVFIKFLAETFKLKGLTTDVFIHNWMRLYGKGCLYGLELFPSFLIMITNAYCGAYVNSQNKIETICGRDLVTLSTTLLRIAADVFDKGYNYTTGDRDTLYGRNNK